jgi:hypothetical protein
MNTNLMTFKTSLSPVAVMCFVPGAQVSSVRVVDGDTFVASGITYRGFTLHRLANQLRSRIILNLGNWEAKPFGATRRTVRHSKLRRRAHLMLSEQ